MMALISLLRRRGQNTILWHIGLDSRALWTMWRVLLLLLALARYMSVGAIVDAVGLQSTIRMGEDRRRIRHRRIRTSHVILELRVHRRSGVSAAWPVCLRRKRPRCRKCMATINPR